jgi:hypothetical protein
MYRISKDTVLFLETIALPNSYTRYELMHTDRTLWTYNVVYSGKMIHSSQIGWKDSDVLCETLPDWTTSQP